VSVILESEAIKNQNYVTGVSKLRRPNLVMNMKNKTCGRHKNNTGLA